jgi:hypothetical protein
MPSIGVGAVAVVFAGLALVGCEKKGSGPMPPPEPEYGVAITDSADGGAPPAGDDAGIPPDEGGGVPVEPEYGVPDNGPPIAEPEPGVAEPEYGVADPG